MSIGINAHLTTLLLAAFAVIAMTGCAVSLDLDNDTTRRIENDTVPVADLRSLDVTTENGAIDVVAAPVDEIEIRTALEESNRGDAAYAIDVDDERLVLTGECDSGWWRQCSVGFRVVVPADLDVVIETDNGRVGVDGLAGTLTIETDNGAIEGDRLEATAVRANTDNGRIQLRFETAPTDVDAKTDNGAIAIRLPAGDEQYDVDADSDNGNIDIDVITDPTAGRHVTARSNNGVIEIEQGMASS